MRFGYSPRGNAEQVADRIREVESAGVDLLLQFNPQYEEMERFARK